MSSARAEVIIFQLIEIREKPEKVKVISTFIITEVMMSLEMRYSYLQKWLITALPIANDVSIWHFTNMFYSDVRALLITALERQHSDKLIPWYYSSLLLLCWS